MTTTDQRFAQVLEIFNSRMRMHSDRIEKLIEDLKQNPVSALKYAAEDFGSAAKISVYKGLLGMVENPNSTVTLEQMTKFVRDQVVRAASCPSRSTSATANLMQQVLGVAWAEAYEFLEAAAQ